MAAIFGVIPVPRAVMLLLTVAVFAYCVRLAMQNAFRIRTFALKEYGLVIHEFDPWFNFRATQYFSKHGWTAFFHWYDYMSWYPLGRPVGTTIYPGLQITSVAIHRLLRFLGPDYKQTLNYVCCYLPCWGGASATLFTALLAWECSGSAASGVFASAIMAILPAHIMRSVGGGFDNESIGMTGIVMTFYFWALSLRNRRFSWFGIVTGISYGYMVAAWGGFVIVLNMIALHAAVLATVDALTGRYSIRLWRAYTLFFIVGTAIATRVPPVGWNPFKSLEQISAWVLFILMQALHLSERQRSRTGAAIWSVQGVKLRIVYLGGAIALMYVAYLILMPAGFFGPLSARVRGLFVKHTRTGNPLVDSVAEHQPASDDALKHYLHDVILTASRQYGIYVLPLMAIWFRRIRAGSFLILYSVTAYYFCLKMARLILVVAPAASILTGVLGGLAYEFCLASVLWSAAEPPHLKEATKDETWLSATERQVKNACLQLWHRIVVLYQKYLRVFHVVAAACVIYFAMNNYETPWKEFAKHSEDIAHQMSSPQIMFKSRDRMGKEFIVDDYREAYHWLRDKTPQDSRVMAWWDYGYQITGIGNRTSIADGNTWNHEHIATLGTCLTSPVPKAHQLIRHLADYVLVWAGGHGDDLAKSPHMARIGNSVYRGTCPGDPTCRDFGFYDRGYDKPTPMMKASLLYNLHQHNIAAGVRVDPKLFKEVKSSKFGLVRIFQVMNVSTKSKSWVADPANRVCDAPGSWYCNGQYPPAKPIQALLSKRRPFGGIEDINKRDKFDEKYHKEYMKRMGGE